MDFGEKLMKMFSKAVERDWAGAWTLGRARHGRTWLGPVHRQRLRAVWARDKIEPGGVHGMEGLHSEGKEEIQHENDGRSM